MSEQTTDGERFLPDSMRGVIALEHYHRYLFALQFAAGRDVLDIASGEGYGSALLAGVARSVLGVDIDAPTVELARQRYPSAVLRFEVGDCAQIPASDASVDLVVSFETLEHHDRQEAMLREIRRVLRPDGLLVISTPDRRIYSEKSGFRNPFHVKELDEAEFVALLGQQFAHVRLLRQRVMAASWLLPDRSLPGDALQFFGPDPAQPPRPMLADAPYMVAVACGIELPAFQTGALEQDIAVLASGLIRDQVLQTIALVKALAVPGSPRLREYLDAAWYLQQNPDLSSPGFDRYEHWMRNGASEGRMPGPDIGKLVEDLAAERVAQSNTGQLIGLESRLVERWDGLAGQMGGLVAALRTQEAAISAEARAWRASLEQIQARLRDDDSAVAAAMDRDAELARANHERLVEMLKSLELALAQSTAAVAASLDQLESRLQALDSQLGDERAARTADAARLSEGLQAAMEYHSGQASELRALLSSVTDRLSELSRQGQALTQTLVARFEALDDSIRSRAATEASWLDEIGRLRVNHEALLARQLSSEARALALEDQVREARAAAQQERRTLLEQLGHEREAAAARDAQQLQALQVTADSLRAAHQAQAQQWERERLEAADRLRASGESLDSVRQELSDALRRLAESEEARRTESVAYAEARHGLELTLAAMRASRSWRWTAPLRSLFRRRQGHGMPGGGA